MISDRQKEENHRMIVRQVLSFTLTPEMEKELLYHIARAFDLPFVIGERYIRILFCIRIREYCTV